MEGATVGESTSPGAAGSGHSGSPEGVDWWNVTTPEYNTADTASLPLDVWAPLLPHDTGCT